MKTQPLTIISCLLLVGTAAGSPLDFQEALHRAMRPYYAALVASARGDAEGTQRQLLLFEAQWPAARAAALAGAPPPLASDPRWPEDLTNVTHAIERTRTLLRSRDLEGAHGELESIRMILREAARRHGLRSFDDAVTDFHEAMERLVSRIPHQHEVRLTPEDFSALGPLLEGARREWRTVQGMQNDRFSPAERAALARVDRVLDRLTDGIAKRSAAELSVAAVELKNAYLDLLLVL